MKLPTLSQNARMALIGAFVFALFGIFMTPWLIWSKARVAEMATWPSVDAMVEEARVKSVYRKNEGRKYQHDISYTYSISGSSLRGDRVSYGDRPPEWGSESQALRELPAIGSLIRIRYNPKDPEDSVIHVLMISESTSRYLLGVSAFAGLAGAGLMAAALWEMKRNKK